MPLFGRVNLAAKQRVQELEAELAAAYRSQAVIQFDMHGTIIAANELFLALTGYAREEIVGQHHSLFVEPRDSNSEAYREFWAALNRGEFFSREIKRIGKNERPLWLLASYNPVFSESGTPIKVVKYATDVTAAKLRSADDAAKISAIMRAQAVVEFTLDGTILTANRNFLQTMGYAAHEIAGKHHRIFVEPGYSQGAAYREFWARLAAGEFVSSEFKRVGKGGREVWLQASYNPVFDPDGKPVKIVKFATDITSAKMASADAAGQIAAISRSQAVIEFDLDGTILTANENFLSVMGYSLAEVQGRRHSMFADDAYARSSEYREFWAALGRGEFASAEFRRLAKGGRVVWLQASYNPIFDLNGRPFKIVKYATDITAMVEQRASFNLLALVANETDNSVVITDEQKRITYVNRGFERLTGYTLSEVKGRSPGKMLQGPSTDPETIARIRSKLGRGEPFYEEILNYNRDKQPYWISMAINPVRGPTGQIERYISVQANITETKIKSRDFDAKLVAIGASNAMAEWTIGGAAVSGNDFVVNADGELTVGLSAVLDRREIDILVQEGSLRREVLWPTSRSDSQQLWLDALFSVLTDLEGKPARILMCGSDITARRVAISNSTQAMSEMMSKITSLVESLSGFARQTNLLALNAAIEAARAQEAGKGFAIVAQEIRKLAVEAGKSVGEVEQLISESRSQIIAMSESQDDRRSTSSTAESKSLPIVVQEVPHDALQAA